MKRLTPNEVARMRGMWERGEVTRMQDLAAIFNLSTDRVRDVIRLKVYREVSADYLTPPTGDEREGKDATTGTDME